MTAQLDWYGCATFRLTLGSLVIFLDTYIDRIPGAAGTVCWLLEASAEKMEGLISSVTSYLNASHARKA